MAGPAAAAAGLASGIEVASYLLRHRIKRTRSQNRKEISVSSEFRPGYWCHGGGTGSLVTHTVWSAPQLACATVIITIITIITIVVSSTTSTPYDADTISEQWWKRASQSSQSLAPTNLTSLVPSGE
jgi:hypothetical protein